jgi:hypothetical protein
VSDELAEAELRSDAEYEQLASSQGPLPPESVYRKAKWAIGEIDRLRAVEKAAAALVERLPHDAYVAHGVDPVSRAIVPGSCVKCDLTEALFF